VKFVSRVKQIVLLVWGLIFQTSVLAVEISVGTARFSIPSPDGYAEITSDMKPFADFAKRFVPPSNEQFALFVPEEGAAAAARGEMPQPRRTFYVQTAKTLIQSFVSAAEFAELKRTVMTQNEEIYKKVESRMPGLLQKVNKGISNDYNVNLNLSMDQMVPLPPHSETERSLAYSTLVKYKLNGKGGKPYILEGFVTATLVHIQGKVLMLYANAEKSGLDWSRSESQKWADSIIEANPSTGEIAARESRPAGFHMDWMRVFASTVIGGIIGLLIYVLRKKTT